MIFELQAIECPRYGVEIQCLSCLLCDLHQTTLKLSVYLRPPGDCYYKRRMCYSATKHLSE